LALLTVRFIKNFSVSENEEQVVSRFYKLGKDTWPGRRRQQRGVRGELHFLPRRWTRTAIKPKVRNENTNTAVKDDHRQRKQNISADDDIKTNPGSGRRS
jgi:hypothetical protein